jgi:hypothetical protein
MTFLLANFINDPIKQLDELLLVPRNPTILAPSGGKSPHPSTQDGSDDKRDHAYPHRYLVSSDRYLRLSDQTHHMGNGKKRKNHTSDTQSGSL